MKYQVIDKGYARIYIDIDGYCLQSKAAMNEFMDRNIVSDYYEINGMPGLQWNFYLISVMPKDSQLKEQLEWFHDDTKYCRKYSVTDEELNNFIEKKFPELGSRPAGSFTLITGRNKLDAYNKFIEYIDKRETKSTGAYEGYHMSYGALDTLTRLDNLRGTVINGWNAVYYTHIEVEIGWVEKKFKFLGDGFKHI